MFYNQLPAITVFAIANFYDICSIVHFDYWYIKTPTGSGPSGYKNALAVIDTDGINGWFGNFCIINNHIIYTGIIVF